MGYDTSFHPVDLGLVETRLLPYLAGHGDDDALDDVVARAVTIRKTRFHAKAWALGVQRVARRDDSLPFEADLHVWGRPFFIVGDGADLIAEDIERYLAATTPEDVAGLATEMIHRIDPALAGRVEPDQTGYLPDDGVLAKSLSTAMRVLRGAALALRAGERTVRHPHSGDEFDAAEVLSREVPFCLLKFAAALLPGWMSRGRTWPTYLCGEAGLAHAEFDGPEPLRALLCEEFPGLDWPPLPPSITGNYMVGGLVRAADVPAVRTRLASHRYALKCDALDAQKLDEALGVAERLGTAFCEATEVYSGMEGELN